jgi:hypothetical protein
MTSNGVSGLLTKVGTQDTAGHDASGNLTLFGTSLAFNFGAMPH